MREETKRRLNVRISSCLSMNVLSQDADDLFLVSMGTSCSIRTVFRQKKSSSAESSETDFSTVRLSLSDVRKKGKRPLY